MDVAIVGGSGFIGRNVVAEMAARGHEVTNYDPQPPPPRAVGRWVPSHLPERDHDALFMLAAMADVVQVKREPVDSIVSNVVLPARIYAESVEKGVRRFFFSSTIWVYDYSDGHREDSTANIVSPANMYSAGKLCAEVMLRSMEQQFDNRLPLTVMRYGIPYGPDMRGHAVIPAFIEKMLKDEELVVNGSLEVARPFLHVRDLARGNAALIDADPGTYNVSGDRFITLAEIISELSDLFGREARLRVNEQRNIDTKATLSPIDKMLALGWRPEITLREGLKEMIDHMRERVGAAPA